MLFTWPVGGSHDENLAPCLQPIHLSQQLVHYTHTGSGLNTKHSQLHSAVHIICFIFNHLNMYSINRFQK